MKHDSFPKMHLLFHQRDAYLARFNGDNEGREARALAETLKEFFTTLLPGAEHEFRAELTRLCLMKLAVRRLEQLRKAANGGVGGGGAGRFAPCNFYTKGHDQ